MFKTSRNSGRGLFEVCFELGVTSCSSSAPVLVLNLDGHQQVNLKAAEVLNFLLPTALF